MFSTILKEVNETTEEKNLLYNKSKSIFDDFIEMFTGQLGSKDSRSRLRQAEIDQEEIEAHMKSFNESSDSIKDMTSLIQAIFNEMNLNLWKSKSASNPRYEIYILFQQILNKFDNDLDSTSLSDIDTVSALSLVKSLDNVDENEFPVADVSKACAQIEGMLKLLAERSKNRSVTNEFLNGALEGFQNQVRLLDAES